MKPMEFDEANAVLRPPANMENVRPLHVQRMPDGSMRSEWELTAHELAELIVRRRIVLSVFSDVHPPVLLFVKGMA